MYNSNWNGSSCQHFMQWTSCMYVHTTVILLVALKCLGFPYVSSYRYNKARILNFWIRLGLHIEYIEWPTNIHIITLLLWSDQRSLSPQSFNSFSQHYKYQLFLYQFIPQSYHSSYSSLHSLFTLCATSRENNVSLETDVYDKLLNNELIIIVLRECDEVK